MLQLIEEHRSPHGLLTLKVRREDDGDVGIGFDGYSRHTHAEILSSLSGLAEDEAVRHFLDDLRTVARSRFGMLVHFAEHPLQFCNELLLITRSNSVGP